MITCTSERSGIASSGIRRSGQTTPDQEALLNERIDWFIDEFLSGLPDSERVTPEELAMLLHDAFRSILDTETPRFNSREVPPVDLEELSRLLMVAAVREGRRAPSLGEN